jgi:hypothetical protein
MADIQRSDPEWVGRCETLDLLSLEAQYLDFILDMEKEIRYLEHFLECPTCLSEAINLVDEEANDDWSRLFSRETTEIIRTGRPRFKDYDKNEAFVRARIFWRLDKLESLLIDAENEMENLQKELKKRL